MAQVTVTIDGKGNPDLWNDVPDILASTANYLAKWKWNRDMPWGFEVFVPKGFDYRKSRATFAEWAALGVTRADGKPFPVQGNGILFFPSAANRSRRPGPRTIRNCRAMSASRFRRNSPRSATR